MDKSDNNAVDAPASEPVQIIKPGRQGIFATLSEARRYHELFYFLFWRDITVRYKQTIFGVLWIFIQPLLASVMFLLIRVLLKGSENLGESFIMVLTGMTPWLFFSGAIRRSSGGLVGNSALITKVYFPRIIIPSAAALSGLVDFAIALLLVGGFLIYGILSPGIPLKTGLPLLTLPLFTIFALILAVSIGMFFSALNVRFRDVGFILGYFIQLGQLGSATFWTLAEVTDKYPKWGPLVALNPFVGLIEGFRWSLMGGVFPGFPLLVTCCFTFIVFWISLWYFMKVERTFADVI